MAVAGGADNRWRWLSAGTAVLLLVHFLGLWLLPVRWSEIFSKVFLLMLNVAAAACLARRAGRSSGCVRAVWAFFTVSFAIWVVANTVSLLESADLPVPEPVLLAFIYRIYTVPLAMVLFLHSENHPTQPLKQSVLDFLQVAIVFSLVFLGLFYLPQGSMSEFDSQVRHYSDIAQGINLVLLVGAYLRWLTTHGVLRDPLRRLVIFVAAYSIIAAIGNCVLFFATSATNMWFDLAWDLPYILGGWLALSAPAVRCDVAEAESASHAFWERLGENLAVAWMIATVAVLSNRVGEKWHFAGYLAVFVSLSAYALRLTLSQQHQHTKDLERAEAEAQLRTARDDLSHLLHEAKQQAGELAQLGELGSLLQSCMTVEEAYVVIAEAAQNFLPGFSGALLSVTKNHDCAETAAAWGTATPPNRIFDPRECWAMRRGRLHRSDSQSARRCTHFEPAAKETAFCIPLMAQGEAFGALILVETASVSQPLQSGEETLRRVQQIGTALAEQVALALANLKLRDALRNQAIRDPLTGLFNRRYMEETLERELLRGSRWGRQVSVVMLDLDHFKHYNDDFGHDAGDSVLRSLGELLRNQTRGDDVACRYGGEEFVIIMPEAPLDTARQRAEQIRDEVAHLLPRYQGALLDPITVSIGVACSGPSLTDAATLLKTADTALYQAKASGRDRVACGGEQTAVPSPPPVKNSS